MNTKYILLLVIESQGSAPGLVNNVQERQNMILLCMFHNFAKFNNFAMFLQKSSYLGNSKRHKFGSLYTTMSKYQNFVKNADLLS